MRDDHPDWPPIVLVIQGTADQAADLLEKRWPTAPVITDPEQELWRTLEVERASWGELFGPKVWLAGLRSLLRGHFVGRPVGDPLLRPAAFLMQAGEVRWRFAPEHSGDLAEEAEFAQALTEAAS